MPAPLRQAYSRVNMSQPELNQLDVQEVIARWQRFPGDTGSTEVQVAVITKRMQFLARHMQENRKDMDAKRFMEMYVQQRVRLLKYLRRTDRPKYQEVISELSIRPHRSFDPTLPQRPKQLKVKGKKRR